MTHTHRILVVDDSLSMRTVLRRGLVLAGVEDGDITEAVDGAEGLAATRAQAPTLILTDVNMPRMSGLDLLREVKADPTTAAIPVIIVTSVSNSRTLLELMRLGAKHVIRKPFDPASLPATLATFLELPVFPDEPTVAIEPEPPIAPALQAALAKTLEDFAFTMIEPCAAPPPTDKVLVLAEVQLHNARVSTLRVATSLSIGRRLAASILGIAPEEDRDDTVFDSVAEIANVLAGELLIRLGNTEGDSHFSIPRRVAVAPGQPLPPLQGFALDGGEDVIYAGVET